MANYQEDIPDYQEDEFNEDQYEEDVSNGIEEFGDGSPEEMKKRVEEMEEELARVTQMQQQVTDQLSDATDKIEDKSIYVGQVDYEATPEELQAHFSPCGTINRVTIICDQLSGHSKGYAYVEFLDKEAAEKALKLDDSTFKGRQLKVLPKRQNLPSVARGGRGRGRTGPIYGGRASFRGGSYGGRGYFPPSGGRGRGGRGAPRGGGRFYRGRGPGRAPTAYQNPYY